MRKLILIRYGEIALKKQNRNFFINTLIHNIQYALSEYKNIRCEKIQGRILVEDYDPHDETDILLHLQKVFGIVSVTKAVELEANLENIKEAALELIRDKHNITFKVESKRGDKSFPYQSPEISRQVGAYILINTNDITVDVHHPDVLMMIEVHKKAYIYYEDVPCEAGLPLGTGGRGGLLLSGGIDSPVAGYLIAKRGMKVDAIHFHSYPFTSLEAQEKALHLAEKLRPYNMGILLHNVPLTHLQEEIIRNCDRSYLTVILRRCMFRCAQQLAQVNGLQALITGESLGQVASQTIESIICTDAAVDLPILRPLIGMDKNDIVTMAKHIDTYDISILPYEDCCTIFVPKHPQTKPRLEKVLEQEEKLPLRELIDQAVSQIETLRLD